jgi:hypothetical protein
MLIASCDQLCFNQQVAGKSVIHYTFRIALLLILQNMDAHVI